MTGDKSRKTHSSENVQSKSKGNGERENKENQSGFSHVPISIVRPEKTQVEEKPSQEIAILKEPTDQEKIKELTDHLQRLAAEFENFKKRTSREMEQMRKIGEMNLMEKVLPILDNMELAVISASSTDDIQALRKGLNMINRQLFETFEKAGLERIQAEVGAPMDVNCHEVVMGEPTDEYEPQTILMQLHPGYRFKGTVLRPAKVKVSVQTPTKKNGEQKESQDV